MEKILSLTKDFKIIPENYKNSGELDILDINDNVIKAKVKLLDDQKIEDYSKNTNVEVFGANDMGLVYFETKILKRENNILYLNYVPDYSIIQRREYSRVILEKGCAKFSDLAENFVEKIEDISAGGLKIESRQALELEKSYKLEISLSNNMKLNCNFQPIRIIKKNNGKYEISGKFVDMENLDRIVLVQYAFKIKMEEQNKDN